MPVRTPHPAAPRPIARAPRPVVRQHTIRLIAPPSDEPDSPITRITPPGSSPRWLLIVLVSLLAVTLLGLGWAGLRWHDRDRLTSAHEAALAAAKQATVDFVSISASSVDNDLQRISAAATGDFKDEFTRGMPQVRQVVVENKVESTGEVLRAGLVSGDLDSAVVLVAIDASVKNVGAPDGRLSHYRIQVDLALDASGRWLVSRLQFVG